MMDIDLFIQEVHERQEIWMSKNPHHKNKVRVKKQWDDIKKLHPEHTVDELKRRWKNLKDTYRKELKRLPQSRPGVPADNFKSGWRYFEALGFLKDELYFAGKDQTEDDACMSQDKFERPADPLSQPASPASSKSDEELLDAPASFKRKDPKEIREEFLKIERKKMKILEEEIARSNQYMKSDNYHFLMSLLPEMDKLPPLQKLRLRTKISQAVLEEVSLNMYGEQPSYNITEVQQINFQETSVETSNIVGVGIKEEAINMYE